ncbi:MAG: toll/interleukin-1 receptor domain-containing protein [Clostridium sp.]|nr:toll/interleukin-1 receptor domain-containing protein [Clostridium sp.]
MFFICFSHVERYKIAQSLSYHIKNFGFKVWYDYDELFIGDNGDKLNFDEGLNISQYIVIIVSENLFHSPCAVEELNVIYKLYQNKNIVIIPILYNLTGENIPTKFSWLKEFIYDELTKDTGTADVATQIVAKYFEDQIRTGKFHAINEFISQREFLFNNYIKELLISYSKLDIRNINGRVSLLYSISRYICLKYDTIKIPYYCTKSILYLEQFSNLNISINFKEISIMENALTIMLNIVHEHLCLLK